MAVRRLNLLANKMAECPRKEIIAAIRANRRYIGQPPKEPSEWQPFQIMNPKTGMSFSDTSAWHFIAELLENPKIQATQLTLKQPPGDTAWVILHSLERNSSALYIKVALKNGNVIGRSFHLSRKGDDYGS